MSNVFPPISSVMYEEDTRKMSLAWRGFLTAIYSTMGTQTGELFFEQDSIKNRLNNDIELEASNIYLNGYKLDFSNLQNEYIAVVSDPETISFVDANTYFTTYETGDCKLTYKSTADTGWVLVDDGTIGNALSGATTRANADTEDLFAVIWNNISDTYAPVSGGRGASASADFDNNKTIKLPGMLGRVLGVSGSGSRLTSRALGETDGDETVTLTIGQTESHSHNMDADHESSFPNPKVAASVDAQDGPVAGNFISTPSTSSAGGGGAHNNMQPTSFFNVQIKL